MGALPSPQAKGMKLSFAVLLFLLIVCETAPIRTAVFHPATPHQNSVPHIISPTTPHLQQEYTDHQRAPNASDGDSRTPANKKYQSNHIKPSLDRLSREDEGFESIYVRKVSPKSVEKADVELKKETVAETERNSIFKVIQPAINAALSGETHIEQTIHPAEKVHRVDYMSPPLRGTEGRDQEALGIQNPKEPRISTPSDDYALGQYQHQDHNSRKLQDPKGPEKVKDGGIGTSGESPGSSDLWNNQENKGVENPSTVIPRLGNTANKVNIPASRDTARYDTPALSTNYDAPVPAASTVISSAQGKPRSGDAEKKTKDFAVRVKEVIKATTKFGRAMYAQVKATLKSLRPIQKSQNPPIPERKRKDGYTEEDVLNLVNDIMREIQMRTDDVQDHAEMLQKTDRWDPNDITRRERQAGVGEGPLLYMRTKVVVTPENVVDAVMTSTKKMFSSRSPPLPWNETSKLLKEVQTRLSEVLTPAN